MGRSIYSVFLATTVVLVMTGCEEDRATRLQDSIDTTPVSNAEFDPTTGVIPFPNNLLFTGTTDGTLNIPVADPNDLSDPKVAMNTLDGFSTSAPISTTFATPIDAATIPGNVRLFSVAIDDFNVNPAGPPSFGVLSVQSELTFGVDFVAQPSAGTTLVIVPLRPLAPKSGYMVVIRNGLADTSGVNYTPAPTYALSKETTPLVDGTGTSLRGALSDAQAQALEPLRMLNSAAETAVITFDPGLNRSDIVLSWSFSTQSTSDVLNIVRAAAPTTPTLGTFTAWDPTLLGLPATFTIYSGTLDVPYYLTSGVGALSGSWKGFDGLHLSLLNLKTPLATETITIPVLVTVPNAAAMNSAAIPVTIFQHGITSNRSTVLALADTMAGIGQALVAIDLPLHGLTPGDGLPFYSAGIERTFNLDLVDNTTSAPGSDGNIDDSGTHFINLTNLQTSRDNVRQAVADLFVLTRSIVSMDVDGGGADFDAANISFIGHSLGAIVGVPFLALETGVNAGVIAMPGGGIAKVLDGSATFGPIVSAGLAANGVVKGTADYEAFFLAAQTMLDSADPVNYGVAAAGGHNILALEIVGSATSPSDLVIPNTVPDGNDSSGTVAAPVAGTEPLLGAPVMNLTQVNATATDAINGLDVAIKYTGGHHSSLLTPLNNSGNGSVAFSAEVTTEIHTNVASFLASGGQQVTVVDPAGIVAAP